MNNRKLLSIGEVAKIIGITRRIILHYEECGLVQPDVRDGATGKRYYTIDTLTMIRTIRIFQDLGLSLSEIGGYFDGSLDLPPLIHRLEAQRDELDRNIEKLKERSNGAGSQIKQVLLPRQTIYRRSYSAPTVAERTKLLRDTAIEGMYLYGTDVTQRMYFTEYSLDGQTSDVSFCVAISQRSQGEYVEDVPAMDAICIFHHGAYEELPDVLQKLLCYAGEQGMKPLGMFRHIYLEGPPQHKEKGRFVTQVALPILYKSRADARM